MALYAIAFLGSTPIGAPLMGWVADVTNPRVAILVGGVATLAACLPLALRYCRSNALRAAVPVEEEASDAEPGEVVDFAPGPLIESGGRQTPSTLRPARSA
jgi:hypothetical protein